MSVGTQIIVKNSLSHFELKIFFGLLIIDHKAFFLLINIVILFSVYDFLENSLVPAFFREVS